MQTFKIWFYYYKESNPDTVKVEKKSITASTKEKAYEAAELENAPKFTGWVILNSHCEAAKDKGL